MAEGSQRADEERARTVGRSQRAATGSIAYAIAVVAYPVGVYFAFAHLSARVASLVLLAIFLPAAATRLGTRARTALMPLAMLPVLTVVLLGFAAVADSSKIALLVPAVINAGLLTAFAGTLLRGPPMIERFARLQVEDLGAAELRWCRGWTWGWTVFFFGNGTVALLLARGGSLEAWTTYNGLIAYVLLGMMFGVEYVLRKYRFGRLGRHPLDRILRATFVAIGKSPESRR